MMSSSGIGDNESFSNSQTQNFIVSDEKLPVMVVKGERGDLLEDLSQKRNDQSDLITGSQESFSCLGAPLPSPDPSFMTTLDDDVTETRAHYDYQEMDHAQQHQHPPVPTPSPLEYANFQPPTHLFTPSAMAPSTPAPATAADHFTGSAQDMILGVIFNFKVTVPPLLKTKNLQYVFSNDLLYAKSVEPKAENKIPFILEWPQMDLQGYSLRIVPVFEDPVYQKTPVERCHNHRNKDTHPHRANFVRTDHIDATYCEADGMYALIFRQVLPESVNLQFTCFNSCPGIGKKNVQLVFELSHDDCSMPSFTVRCPIRACAAPARDATKDSEKKGGRVQQPTTTATPAKSEYGNGMAGVVVKTRNSCTPAPFPTPSSTTTTRPSPVSQFQRKRPPQKTANEGQRGESEVKRERREEQNVFTINIYGEEKYRQVRAFIKNLEENERYKMLRSQARGDHQVQDEPLDAQLSQLSVETDIKSWLVNLNREALLGYFESNDFACLGDIEHHYTPELFHKLGIPLAEADYLNKIYLNWHNFSKADADDKKDIALFQNGF